MDDTDIFETHTVIGKQERVEAYRYDGTYQCANAMKHWIRENGGRAGINNYQLDVTTLQGLVTVQNEEWVINLGQKKFLVLTHEIFANVYQMAP